MKFTKKIFSILTLLTLSLLVGCSSENAASIESQPTSHSIEHTKEYAKDIPESKFHLDELELDHAISNPLYMNADNESLTLADMKPDAVDILRFDGNGQFIAETTLNHSLTAGDNEISGIRNISYQPYGVWCVNYLQEQGVGGDHDQENSCTEFLTRYDANGAVTVELELSQELEVRDVLAISDGCLLLTDHAILHYSMEGSQDWKIESDTYFSNFIYGSDKKVYCATLYDDGYVYFVDEENRSLIEILSDCGQVDFLYAYENTLCGCDETRLFLYDLETGDISSYLDFSELGILAVLDAAPYRDGIAIIFHSAFGGKSVGILQKEASISAATDELKIGMLRGDGMDFIRGVIELFQLRNTTYSVQIVEYADISTLSTALIGGNAPDLLCLNGLPVEKYCRTGVLRNLYDSIDANTLVSAYQQFETNGELYAITPDFSLGVLFCDPDIISPSVSSFSEMLDAVSASQGFASSHEFANVMVAYSLNSFVDLEQRTCEFDSPEFEALLQMCAPSQNSISEETLPAIAPVEITTIDQYTEIRDLGMECAGFPKGPVISRPANNLIGICANTTHLEEAEHFIWFMLGEEVQNAVIRNGDSFPANAAVLRGLLSQNDAQYADSFYAQLDRVQGIDLSSTGIYEIIKAELSLFLNEKQSVSVTASHIQSRVSIYLLESN